MNKNDLANEILGWYWLNKEKIKQNKRFWEQDSIGYAIRSIMKEENRWKKSPRGKSDINNFNPKIEDLL